MDYSIFSDNFLWRVESWFLQISRIIYQNFSLSNSILTKKNVIYVKNKNILVIVSILHKLNKVFKNGPSKFCRIQPLKNLKWCQFNFLKAVFTNFTWSIFEYIASNQCSSVEVFISWFNLLATFTSCLCQGCSPRRFGCDIDKTRGCDCVSCQCIPYRGIPYRGIPYRGIPYRGIPYRGKYF